MGKWVVQNFLYVLRRGVYVSFSRRFGWWGNTNEMKLTLIRNKKTHDGIFGNLMMNMSLFKCFTCENLDKAVHPGTYLVKFDYSPRFNRTMPHLIVPDRDSLAGGDAGIRIHWGNNPSDYQGCIGVGNGQQGDSIDNTVETFNKLYSIINPHKDVSIEITENYG